MPDYTPPPQDLSVLNPIQRYMQKGELDVSDYTTLLIVVLAYFVLRPRIEGLFRWAFAGGKDLKEGEDVTREYKERREVAKDKETEVSGNVRNRKGKGKKDKETRQDESIGAEKVPEDKLVDWDDYDEVHPRRAEAGDKADVVKWLDRWDREVDA